MRRALGGSPSGQHEHSSHAGKAPGKYQPQLDMVCDKAKDLCSDPWLANKMALEIRMENGKESLHTAPAESLPYIKAAYAIKRNELPKEVSALLEGVAA